MVSKKRVLGIKKSKTTKFRKQNKTKVRKSFKLTNKSKKHHKKRKHNTKRRFRLKGGADKEGLSLEGEEGYNFDDNDDDDECPICIKKFKADDETITTSCGHKFHKNELIRWCRRYPDNMTCPIDRKNINEEMTEYIQQNNSDSDNSTESSLDSNMETLENFIGVTVSLLDNVPYVPLPEAPYLDGVDLPVAVEGGPREKIKNMLICLFADDDYFYNNFELLNGHNIINIANYPNYEDGSAKLKIELISWMMSLVNNNRDYSDDHLRGLIMNALERNAADVLMIPLPL